MKLIAKFLISEPHTFRHLSTVQKMSLVEETCFVYIEVLGRKRISGCSLKITDVGSKSVIYWCELCQAP